MHKYEAMFIVKPDLSEQDQKTVFVQIQDVVAKNNGQLVNANIWSEKRRLTFPIKKQQEGVYYLAYFNAPADTITKMKYAFKLNENILRVLILNPDA